MKAKAKVQEVRLRLFNYREVPTQLVVEPWGDFYPIKPRDDFVIIATGPEPMYPEVSYDDDSITFWGWIGSTVQVLKNRKVLADYTGLPVPNAFPKSVALPPS